MPEEPRQPIGRLVLTAFVVSAFGFGALWSATQGVKISFNINAGSDTDTQTASVVNANDSANLSSDNIPSNISDVSSTFAPTIPKIQNPSQTSNSSTLNSQSLNIVMGGDMMFDRGIRRLAQKNGYDSLLVNVAPLFKTADIAIANLEGPITDNPSETLLPSGQTTKSFKFTFAPATAKALANAGLTAVSLANNHSANFGPTGLMSTDAYLDQAGVRHFGDPFNDPASTLIITKNGITVAFVGYHAFENGFTSVLATVRKLSADGDFVIVMPHWGEEYSTSTSAVIKAKAQALVSAGAGAVIGSHPHVTLEHEWLGDAPVFYSLGNLLFDQYFSPRVMAGNIVDLHVVKVASSTKIDNVSIYTTSMTSKKAVEVDMTPEIITP